MIYYTNSVNHMWLQAHFVCHFRPVWSEFMLGTGIFSTIWSEMVHEKRKMFHDGMNNNLL